MTKPIIVERDEHGALLSVDMVRPSNFHAHVRANALMEAVAFDTMRWVKYLLVMPNTGPIDTVEKVAEYHDAIAALQEKLKLSSVELVMTVYLTEKLTPAMVEELAQLSFRVEVKYYPPHKGATTGSGLGIPLHEVPDETFAAMAAHDMPLLGHFESVVDTLGNELPMSEREGYFMDNEFPQLRERSKELHINIEHASTKKAIDIVKQDTSGKTTCGITPHHMLLSLDTLMEKSWRNHGRCMPIPKSKEDVAACLEFATSGDPRVSLGDDTAPHPSEAKKGTFEEAACGCWLPHSLALYALAFEQAGALDERFVQFACYNAANWRNLPLPDLSDRVRIIKETDHDIPDPLSVPAINDVIIPLGWTNEPDRLKVGLLLDLNQEE